MARTYEQIKAAVELAHPTPDPIPWQLHTDNPGHQHDDQAIVRAEVVFDGVTYILEGHAQGFGSANLEWHGQRVVNEDQVRMPAGLGNYATWEQFKPAMVTAFNLDLDKVRGLMISEIFALEQVADDGIVAAPVRSSDATLASMTGEGVSFTLVEGTFKYSSPTTARQIVLTATRSHNRATLEWVYFSGRPVSGPVAAV